MMTYVIVYSGLLGYFILRSLQQDVKSRLVKCKPLSINKIK